MRLACTDASLRRLIPVLMVLQIMMEIVLQKLWFFRRALALTLLLAFGLCLPPVSASAAAESGGDRVRLVDGASATLNAFLNSGEHAAAVRAALSRARGVLVFADGLDNGVETWRGLLFGRDVLGGWTGPAVYTVASGTFGRSPTDQVDRAMFIALSDVERLIAQRIRLGGSGVSVARLLPGPLPSTDLAVITTSGEANDDPQEAFAGTVLTPDQYATNALYGEPITIREAVASTADVGDDIVNLRARLDASTRLP